VGYYETCWFAIVTCQSQCTIHQTMNTVVIQYIMSCSGIWLDESRFVFIVKRFSNLKKCIRLVNLRLGSIIEYPRIHLSTTAFTHGWACHQDLLHLSVSLTCVTSEWLTAVWTLKTIGIWHKIIKAFLTVSATNRSNLMSKQGNTDQLYPCILKKSQAVLKKVCSLVNIIMLG